jgi:mycofactocin system glycosyltransferase
VRLAFDSSTRLLGSGEVLLGGRPTRLLRLTPAGGRLVADWRDGAIVGTAAAEEALARRLIDAGLAHPVPGPGRWSAADVAVVIPARDRPGPLAECLARVGRVAEVVVVDDGSRDPDAVAAVAREGGARVVRRKAGGPGAARNTGVGATTKPLIAFLDSDTRPAAGWLEPLLSHLSDSRVAAVAPRVAVPAGQTAIAAYEAVRSPLDLGSAPGLVGPGRRVGFVPAAALLVRRESLLAAGGFDAALRHGEDVDLAWRLSRAGWVVRYEPAARVEHPHRTGVRPWLAQRLAYGASAGPLSVRHPGRLRHLVLPRWTVAPWLLALAGRRRAALAAALAGVTAVARRAPMVPGRPGVRRELAAVAGNAQLRIAGGVVDALWRAYPPVVAVVAARWRPARRPLATALAVSVAADWVRLRPRLDPVRFAALRAADDLAYAAGVWLGCARARTIGPLVPALGTPDP